MSSPPPATTTTTNPFLRHLIHQHVCSRISSELPPSELNNRVFSISGSEASPIEIAKLYQEKDSSLVIEHESTETALKRFKEKGDFVAYLKALWEEKGGLSYREDLKKSNDVFPGFKPVDVRSFI